MHRGCGLDAWGCSPDAWGCLQAYLHGAGGELQHGSEGVAPLLARQLARVELLLVKGAGGGEARGVPRRGEPAAGLMRLTLASLRAAPHPASS